MARQCPYCGMAYKNGHGLYIHLTNHAYFEGHWRRPLDGIHDAREITRIVNRDAGEAERHQKPSNSGWRRYLVGLDRPGKGSDKKPVFRFMNLPFGSHVEEVPKRRGIPLEYDSVSCPRTFRGGKTFTSLVHNPLAIMSTSSQIYAEARKVFYSQNKFYFPDLRTLHVFLLGIGDKNVQLLRTVECKAITTGPGTIRGRLRKCLPWIRMAGENPRPSTWYSEILDQILTHCHYDVLLGIMFGPSMHRALMRVGSHKPEKEKDIIYHLFRMRVFFYRHNEQGQEVETNGRVSFKLCAFRTGQH
ncbi:hypothetical protein N7494_005639 [Penicillium frequentans]|uniref:C2H2-type domain-containing protein n=1 Tax=Penicillium frequentans TaxID=3151616 RepID=A0AAD6CUQ6_9EURO|nr:hypothetical protein N7494_005639 [Penicillium glabrum]